MLNGIVGTSLSASFVSCISRMSGWARSSHHSTLSRRAFNELTFQVAIRIGNSLWPFEGGNGAAVLPRRWRLVDKALGNRRTNSVRFGERRRVRLHTRHQ